MEWKQVLDCTIAVLQEQLALHPQTGLLADFLVYSTAEKHYKPAEGTLPPFLPLIGRSLLHQATHDRVMLRVAKFRLVSEWFWLLFVKARSWRKTMMASMG